MATGEAPTDAQILELKEAREAKDRLAGLWHEAGRIAADATEKEEEAEIEWSEARRRVWALELAMEKEYPGYLDPYEEDPSRWAVGRSVREKR